MNSWYTWMFSKQNEQNVTQSASSANTTVRTYLSELQTKLKNDFRAERAECRLNFDDEAQKKVYMQHKKQLVDNIVTTFQNASVDGVDAKLSEIRKSRLLKDFETEMALQTDYMCNLMLNGAEKK